MSPRRRGALSPYRVLDLTDDKGYLCGKMFADLGADVIKVEPPGGDAARRQGPFYRDDPDPEKSLFFWAYNAGKRSVTLDLEQEADRDRLRRLARAADFLVESFPAGRMKALGLGYEDLEAINPGLIMASITPFGQTGPRAGWKGPDIVPWALGGYMWMTGEPERAPLRISHPPQTYLHASGAAAIGCLMALHHRNATGRGQYVDVAAQQCPSWMLTNTYTYWDLMKQNLARAGVLRHFGPVHLKTLWKAKDGRLSFMFSGGSIGAKGQRRVVELMEKEGMSEGWLSALDWNKVDALAATVERLDEITEAFSRFFETKTKAELLDEAVRGGIMLAPVNTVADAAGDVQLKDRGFWQNVRQPEADAELPFPGEPVKMSLTPWRIQGPAPRPGQHNAEVFDAVERETARPEASGPPNMKPERPLSGLKILDFSNTVLGPTTTRYLADHGATVVRVESQAHPETTRISSPYVGGEPGLNRSGYFATHNAGKLSLSLNMTKPSAHKVVEKLIGWADVLIESFAPGVMNRWGLSYEEVRQIKPDIIMASTCLEGQTGPRSAHRGYGQMASALAGWFELTGWPEGEPVGPYSAYSDFIDWNFLLVSILAALDHRRRTGQGQYLDQSQLESAIQFMAPALLDYAANGRVATRMGNRDPLAAPHGAYPCQGQDRWLAIAVTDDEEWQALRKVMGDPAWAREPRFQSLDGRKANEDALDQWMSEWTAGREAEALMNELQAAGVPAGVVQNAEDLFKDPQLAHRGHFARLDHPEMGPYHIATIPFHLSKSNNRPTSPAPLFGQHTELVLREFLKLDDDEITELVVEGALE